MADTKMSEESSREMMLVSDVVERGNQDHRDTPPEHHCVQCCRRWYDMRDSPLSEYRRSARDLFIMAIMLLVAFGAGYIVFFGHLACW